MRSDEQPQRAGFVELLFDVVLVFAFTRLSERLVTNLTWLSFLSTLVLTMAVWWVWYRLAWTTNRYDPNRPAMVLMVIVTMLGTLLMAAAVPSAVAHESGVVFASAYVGVQVLRHLWLVLLGGDRHAQLVSVRVLFWACISAVPWIGGIFAVGLPRLALWSVAIAVDYTAGALDFPTPRLGRAHLRDQPVAQEHLIERYRQVLIIAFGETILSSGIHFSQFGFQRDRVGAFLLAFAGTILLWQTYFYRAGIMLPSAIALSTTPAYVDNLASYAHLIMVVGIDLSAVGDILTISEPFGQTHPSWVLVIFGGPAVFLIGRAMLDYVTFSRVSWSRPIALLLLGALAPLALWLPPLLAPVMVVVVLTSIAIANAATWRRSPRQPTPPTTRPS